VELQEVAPEPEAEVGLGVRGGLGLGDDGPAPAATSVSAGACSAALREHGGRARARETRVLTGFNDFQVATNFVNCGSGLQCSGLVDG
jgi:hypothetical protein